LNGVSIGNSGFVLQSVSANGAVNGVALNNLTGGGSAGVQVTGSGTTGGSGGTIQNTTGAAVSLTSLGSLGGGVTLNNMNITGGGGLLGTNFGSLSFANDLVSATGAPRSASRTGTVTAGSTFRTLSSSGSGTNGVLLSGVSGSFTTNAGTITGATGAAWSVAGGTVGVTYSGTIIQTNNAALLGVSGGHTGTLTFQIGVLSASTLSATNSAGLQFNNADGIYNFNGNTILSGNATIDILTGSSGTFAFSNNTSITNPTGTAFVVNGSSATVTYSGNITKNGTSPGLIVDVTNESAGTITFQTGALSSSTTAGTGINLSNADGTVNFNGTTTLNGGNAHIDINTGSGGTIALGSGASIGAKTSPTGIAFNETGSSANVTYNGTIRQTNAANAVSINAKTGDTTTFAGTITATTTTANAINLTGNTGGTINFAGGLNLTTTSGTGFNATGGGTVNATQNNTSIVNTISGTTGIALNIANTTIGASNLTFRSISAGTAAGSTGVGISLDTTGSSGGLHVVGDGTTTLFGNSSGGTIQHKTGADFSTTSGIGIYLNNTTDVQLANMTLHDFDNFGIFGLGVTGFKLANSTINGANGNSTMPAMPPTMPTIVQPDGEGSIYFGNVIVNGGTTTFSGGLSGTASITSSSISGGAARNVSIIDGGGAPLHLTIDNTTFGLTQNLAGGTQSLIVEARNAGTAAHVTVTRSTFTGALGDLVNFTGQAGTTMDVIFGGVGLGNTLANTHPGVPIGGGGMTLATNGAMRFNVSNNTFSGADGSAITIQMANAATSLDGTFDSNTIGTSGVAGSGSRTGNGIFTSFAGTVTLAITNNTIQQYNGNAGIFADNTGGSYPVNITITGNTVRQPGPNAFAGLALTNGAPGSTDTTNVFAKISGNDFSTGDPANANDIIVGASGSAAGTHTFTLSGATAADVASLTAIQTFLQNSNNLNGASATTAVTAYTDAPVTVTAFNPSASSPPLPAAPVP
jgi:hypothetical protein